MTTSADSASTPDHWETYMDALDAKVKATGALGFSIITSAKATNENKGGGKKTRVYTKEQMEEMRVIIVNERREGYLKKAGKMATCGQKGSCMMFNTHSGNMTILGILRMAKAAKNKKALPDKFDALLGLTFQIHVYDFWVHDNELYGPEGELEEAMQILGKAWSDTLSHTDAELGIDAEYTRPGTEALLSKFADSINCTLEETDTAPFEWDTYKTAPPSAKKKGGKKRKASEEAEA